VIYFSLQQTYQVTTSWLMSNFLKSLSRCYTLSVHFKGSTDTQTNSIPLELKLEGDFGEIVTLKSLTSPCSL